jgi:hypothetical protein
VAAGRGLEIVERQDFAQAARRAGSRGSGDGRARRAGDWWRMRKSHMFVIFSSINH